MALLTPLTGPLGQKRAKHLLNRLTFGGSKKMIDQFASLTVDQALDQLMTPSHDFTSPYDPTTGNTWLEAVAEDGELNDGRQKQFVKTWWLNTFLNSPSPLSERIAFYFHTHFTTIADRVPFSQGVYWQVQLFRYYSLGNFKDLAKKICFDNAMMYHLDAHLNEVGRPNENYAREYLELYTIGKGPQIGDGDYTNYTEQDVKAGALVLSGYKTDNAGTTIDPDTMIPSGKIQTDGVRASRHDASNKVFSEKFNNQEISPIAFDGNKATEDATKDELDQFVDMIFNQKETARYLVRRLYRYFVYYKITDEAEQDIIDPLAQTLMDNNYELEPMLRQFFSSLHFFDEDDADVNDNARGAIIKAPLEIIAGALRFFEVTLPDFETEPQAFYDIANGLLGNMDNQGMNFYEPFEVAGYSAYHQAPGFNRNWITPNYLALRYKFGEQLIVNGGEALGLDWSLMDYIQDTANIADPLKADEIVNTFIDYMLPEAIRPERNDYFLNTKFLDGFALTDWESEWYDYLATNDDTTVKNLLENLLVAILQSPEYQLS